MIRYEFYGIVRTITCLETLLIFVKAVYPWARQIECIMGVNVKQIQEAQR